MDFSKPLYRVETLVLSLSFGVCSVNVWASGALLAALGIPKRTVKQVSEPCHLADVAHLH